MSFGSGSKDKLEVALFVAGMSQRKKKIQNDSHLGSPTKVSGVGWIPPETVDNSHCIRFLEWNEKLHFC